jgi:uncharacterized protein (DUF427 family)
MSKSPGHREMPEHRVREEPVEQTMEVQIGGELVARSSRVIRVDEDDSPVRYYFPRADVVQAPLLRSGTSTKCPFKGSAQYFDLNLSQKRLQNAAWSYEDPYDEHRDLKDRFALHDDRFAEIHVRQAA